MGRTVTLEYRPTAKQLAFHNETADEALYGGAAGGGKSTAVVADALVKCCRTAGVSAWLFRRTYPELDDTLVAIARAMVPAEVGRYNATRWDMRLRNGSVMRFRSVPHDGDVTRYQGAEMQYLYIDELTHFPKDVYDYLRTRVRARRNQRVRPLVRCTANPGGPGHGWVRQRFVDPQPDGGRYDIEVTSSQTGSTRLHTVAYLPARATDNPHLSPEYLFELEQKPKMLRDALLLGNWDAFEGQAFPEWRDDPAHYGDGIGTHVIAPFPIPAHWRRWRSFDFGYSKPFSVGWWAVDEEGRVYRVSEWYGWDGTANHGARLDPRAIAVGIRERETALNFTGCAAVADPSIFDESRGLSVARQMSELGVTFQGGDNKRIPGKMELHYRLRLRDGRPGLYVFSTCRHFIRTVPALALSALRPEDIDTDGEDHVYDETRYLLMANPVRAREPVNQIWRPARGNPLV
jgi:hypothetical protein